MSRLIVEINGKKEFASKVVLCVETDDRPVSMVTFCPWRAKEWVLPWSRLDAVSFAHVEESEQLELFFPHHHIVAAGENLRKVLKDIDVFQVCRLRDLPPSHRASFGPADPFITRLEVHLLADPANRRPANVPF